MGPPFSGDCEFGRHVSKVERRDIVGNTVTETWLSVSEFNWRGLPSDAYRMARL
jgi:hypothetical protein